MERIVGWMKIHDSVMGMDFTLYDVNNDCDFKVANIGRGGAVLLRDPQNIIFQRGGKRSKFRTAPGGVGN